MKKILSTLIMGVISCYGYSQTQNPNAKYEVEKYRQTQNPRNNHISDSEHSTEKYNQTQNVSKYDPESEKFIAEEVKRLEKRDEIRRRKVEAEKTKKPSAQELKEAAILRNIMNNVKTLDGEYYIKRDSNNTKDKSTD